MAKKGYDFAGWVTKNDVRCSDGVIIKHDAFISNHNGRVPLVWQHDYSSPSNVLGTIELENANQGVYGRGYFNDTETAQNAKQLLSHGDITSMSIGAKKIQKRGNDVIHGEIYEVSLVLSGANPGALIEYTNENMVHSDAEDFDNERAVIYTGTMLHSAESEYFGSDEDESEDLTHKEGETKLAKKTDPLDDMENKTGVASQKDKQGKTIGDVLDSLDEEQMGAVEALVANILADQEPDDDDEEDDSVQQSYYYEGEDTLKHNAFNSANSEGVYIGADGTQLTHSDVNTIVKMAAQSKVTSLVDVLAANGIEESDLKHGITNVSVLFPATQLEGGVQVYNPAGLNIDKILGSIAKSPFSRVKNIFADLTESDARARGYIKGNQKLDSISSVFFRETTPGTIYRRDKLDRDDMLDIQENGIDVISFVNGNLKNKLSEEIVRAVFFGDGRNRLTADGQLNPDKIDENNIRPIFKDDSLFTIKYTTADYTTFPDDLVKNMVWYQGSGTPSLYMNGVDIARLRLAKDANGRYLFGGYAGGGIPSNQTVAAALGVQEIVEYRACQPGQAVLVNLADYKLGAVKGGEVTNFDFFDIDFNQYKYLTETRLSGALQTPKSALAITITAGAGADLSALDFNATGVKKTPDWTTETADLTQKPKQ